MRNNNRRLVAGIILVPFVLFTIFVTTKHGFLSFFIDPFTHLTWTQEFVDLGIALTMVSAWMVEDARKTGRTVWPFLVLVPLLASISPLLYIVLGDRGDD